MPEIFDVALRELKASPTRSFGPESFKGYCQRVGLQRVDTASTISVDFLERLAPELRDAGVMVLRLGAHEAGGGTSFALVRADNLARDFFLDDAGWDGIEEVSMEPPADPRRFLPLRFFPKASEYSLLAAGLNGGVFSRALNLDDDHHAYLPISGHFTADFDVKIREDLHFAHRNGQVEVDATFVALRGGKPVLFVIETKRDPPKSGLAKHKLVYPILAMAGRNDPEMAIIPVYCRTWITDTAIHYAVMECHLPDSRTERPALTDLVPVRLTKWSLAI